MVLYCYIVIIQVDNISQMNDLSYKLLVKQEKMDDNAMMLYVQYSLR